MAFAQIVQKYKLKQNNKFMKSIRVYRYLTEKEPTILNVDTP